MEVTDSAYIAVLENKLVQAERSLYEFKRIFSHWTTQRMDVSNVEGKVGRRLQEKQEVLEELHGTRILECDSNGIYPGQLAPLTLDDESDSGDDTGDECLE
jgi:hypothetical protein